MGRGGEVLGFILEYEVRDPFLLLCTLCVSHLLSGSQVLTCTISVALPVDGNPSTSDPGQPAEAG